MTGEDRATRLRRLTMRSWRRGMKEMDLLLGHFADGALAGLGADDLDTYEALLAENDQDLLAWATGAAPAPGRFAALVARIADFARGRHAAGI